MIQKEVLRRWLRGLFTPQNLTDKKDVRETLEEVTVKEGAPARSARPIDRNVLRKQARKARADHVVKCSLLPRKIPKGKPLTELYVNDSFTQDRDAWKKELQRRGAEVYVDPEETSEEQAKRIAKYKKDCNRQFTEDGRVAEITVELVLQARARMLENMAMGQKMPIVSEMIQQLPQENIYAITRCFRDRFLGLEDAPSSRRIVKLIFLRKPDAAPKKGIRSYEAIALTSVMSMWHAACIILRLEKAHEP